MFKAEFAGSLEKVFAETGVMSPRRGGSMLSNERYSFQAVFYSRWELQTECRVEVESDLRENISLRVVEYAGGAYNLPQKRDENYIFAAGAATCYPDILKPFTSVDLCLRPAMWTSVFVTVNGGTPGMHCIRLILRDKNGQELCRGEYELEVIAVNLPECGIPVTQWIHFDCICAYHRVRPFSREFYGVLARYLDTYVLHGGNTLYTPLFTPPLNTPKGEERMTIQTVGVMLTKSGYVFDFSELNRLIEFAAVRGIRYFEFSHLATQWGAEFCPKIVAQVRGEEKKIFGWDTPSTGSEYKKFLTQFLSALDTFLRERGWKDRCFLHISDEPRGEHFATYAQLSAVVRAAAPGYPILDAMSDPVFAARGAADIPVVALSAYENFPASVAESKWAYYCMEETAEYLSNRFLNMPLQRLRVLGFQLWLNGCRGFLHWGFNFYLDYCSRFLLEPHLRSDAGGAYPCGDSFVVWPGYPSPRGRVLDSVRLEVFGDAISDYRSLCLLERLRGKEFVRDFLAERGFSGFSVYPTDGEKHLQVREEINGMIKEGSANEQ